MESKQAKVRCPHCSVEFGFALPQKYVDRPSKKLKFICEYCTERFAVQVSDLFSEDGTELAASKIRHQSIYGLLLYSSWEEVIQSHFGEPIEESDPISAFGKEWKPASMFAELSTIFPNADIRAAISEDEEEPVVESEEELVLESEEDVVVEVEEEPSYEDDLFMDKPLEESAWTDKVEDPFDIPISNITDSIDIPEEANVNDQEDEDVVDLIADGAMDIFLEESEEAPPVMVEEDSEDPFLAISDEIEIQQEHSIDALISTLDSELEETKLSGTNTLDLLQSEEEFPSAEAQKDFVSTVKSEMAEADQPESNTLDFPLSEEEQPDPNQDSLYSEASHEEIEEESEEPLASTVNKEESFESMSTVIDTDPFKSLGLDSEETLQSAPPVEDEDVVLVEATVVSEEDSHESVVDAQTIVSTSSSWIEGENENSIDNVQEPEEEVSFYSPDSWEEEEIEESNNGSESIDYDQTEEEDESQSALNPAFQISTKKVVRKQYWAVASVVALSLIAAVLVVRYSSLSDVSSFFIPIDESEVQNTQQSKTPKQKKIEPKETITQAKTNTETVVKTEKSTSIESKEQNIPKEDAPKIEVPKAETNKTKTVKKEKEEKPMLVVAPEQEVFLDAKPLSKNKDNQLNKKRELPKLPPMDPKRATREGWIKLEDKSYESAKAIFEDVIKNEPTPEAFLGLGFAEERLADRYKDRKDFIRVEAHYDQAHKYYCEAMEYYSREDIVKDELRFGIRYLQARLKVISRACI